MVAAKPLHFGPEPAVVAPTNCSARPPAELGADLDAGARAWLDAMKADIDAITPSEWEEIEHRERSIKRKLEEIEAGRHPFRLLKTGT